MIDLHCHTTASDGILLPAGLIDKAANEGISLIAVADHDNVDGLAEAASQAQRRGIQFIPCIEFSVQWKGGDFHLLGYGINAGNSELSAAMGRLRTIRENRIPLMVQRLNAAGLDVTLAEVLSEAAGAVPGKPHLARALIRKGIVRDIEEAFELWLGGGKPGDVPKEKLTPAEACSLIRKAGGKAVIAHPRSLRLKGDSFDEFLQKYIPEGIDGVEAYAAMHDDADVAAYISAAQRAGLFVTGGSDYHGDKGETLGMYGKGRVVPESCGENLLSALR
jgi:hypothetical protein